MRRSAFRFLFPAVLLLFVTASLGLAADWPFLRASNHRGHAAGAWVADWPASGPTIAWKADVGIGASSFAVQGDRVLTMGNQRDEDVVTCFQLGSGEVLWTFKYDSPFDKRQFDGGTASTPTIDSDVVYTLSYLGHLHALNLSDGKVIWKKHLVDDLGGRLARWKYAGSPLVVGDMLILDTGSARQSTVALNKKTGDLIWGAGSDMPGYASPIPYTQGDRQAVLVFKAEHMVSHDLKTGRVLWRIPWKTSYDVNASSPSVANDILVVSSGYSDGRTAAFRLGDGEPRKLWQQDDLKTKMSSITIVGDHVFGVSSDGRLKGHLMCLKLSDGSVAWSQPGFGQGTVITDGEHLIALSDRGTLVTAKVNGEAYKEVSRAQVLGNTCWVQPVLANGYILAKNNRGQTVCLDVRPK